MAKYNWRKNLSMRSTIRSEIESAHLREHLYGFDILESVHVPGDSVYVTSGSGASLRIEDINTASELIGNLGLADDNMFVHPNVIRDINA